MQNKRSWPSLELPKIPRKSPSCPEQGSNISQMQKPRSGIAQISPAKDSLRWVAEDLRYRAAATRATTPQRLSL
jgi:hypothetical protein